MKETYWGLKLASEIIKNIAEQIEIETVEAIRCENTKRVSAKFQQGLMCDRILREIEKHATKAINDSDCRK